MTAETDLLPLPEPVAVKYPDSGLRDDEHALRLWVAHGYDTGGEPLFSAEQLREAVAPLQAEVEALRAEVREAREFRDKMANAIGNDQLRRFIEKHGEPVPLTARMQQAEARAEQLAEEVEALRAEVATWEGLHASEVQVRQRWQARADNLAEALRLALDSHGKTLLTDPPQDAWKVNRVEEIGRALLRDQESE